MIESPLRWTTWTCLGIFLLLLMRGHEGHAAETTKKIVGGQCLLPRKEDGPVQECRSAHKRKRKAPSCGASRQRSKSKANVHRSTCFPTNERSCLKPRQICEKDLEIGKIAWKYFENNYQDTGLVNSADKYTSTTLWDSGSALAGTIAALELGIIDKKTFDDHVIALLGTLQTMTLYRREVPNKAYSTLTAKMGDYGNNETAEGIGYSALDLGRILIWLDLLGCFHPSFRSQAKEIATSWSYCRMIGDGQMYGAYLEKGKKNDFKVQEGRLGYEQYAGKYFRRLGFDQDVAARYDNDHRKTIEIYGVPIAYDVRDPRKLGAYNYVVTESYTLDAMEHGLDRANSRLVRNIYEVQKRRWQHTDIVTAVSEDNVDRAPWFVYNTIYAAGSPWNTITDQGVDYDRLKSTSVKAAFSLAALYPQDPYSAVIVDRVSSAHNPDRGWYSGVYEKGLGYNKAITANTNGIILEILLYKKYGPLLRACEKCGWSLKLEVPKSKASYAAEKCFPQEQDCGTCALTARR